MKEATERQDRNLVPFTSTGYLVYLGCRERERRQQKFLDLSPSHMLHFIHSLHIMSHVNCKHFDLEKFRGKSEVTKLTENLRKAK